MCLFGGSVFVQLEAKTQGEMGGTKDGADFLGEPKKTCLERERERIIKQFGGGSTDKVGDNS